MKPPFKLIPDTISEDTTKALEQLLEQAKEGRLIGFAFVAMYRNREYIANATGETKRNPTFARGMLKALDDRLGDVQRATSLL